MEWFDFVQWEPSGIASAVHTSLDDGKSDIDKAAACGLWRSEPLIRPVGLRRQRRS